MKHLRVVLLVLGIAIATPASGADLVLPPPVIVPNVGPGERPRNVDFSRVVVKIPDGKVWARWEWGLVCGMSAEDVRWKSDSSDFEPARFKAIFEDEAARERLRSRSENIFEQEVGDGLQAGIVIHDMQAKVCSYRDSDGEVRFRGSATMTAEWQIYDPLKRELVARVKTFAGGREPNWQADGLERIIYAAYRESVRALFADYGYRQVILAAPGAGVGMRTPGSANPPISLVAPSRIDKRTISDTAGSVVLILADKGHGSGFLVSQEGYFLTNQHVVGTANVVKIRWPDGVETIAKVISRDRGRDVALVKADPRGRAPLSLRRGALQTGETVYAVGTPLSAQFQGTVTKGAVSATRVYEGLTYIQSDVSVNPGNSGGPLLDEDGAVIGIAVATVGVADRPTGINLFIPVGEALDFLNVVSPTR